MHSQHQHHSGSWGPSSSQGVAPSTCTGDGGALNLMSWDIAPGSDADEPGNLGGGAFFLAGAGIGGWYCLFNSDVSTSSYASKNGRSGASADSNASSSRIFLSIGLDRIRLAASATCCRIPVLARACSMIAPSQVRSKPKSPAPWNVRLSSLRRYRLMMDV